MFCAGVARVDPETARQEFADAGFEMIAEYVNARTPTLCRCTKCRNEVSPQLRSVRNGSGCWFCTGREPVDIETARREFAAAGLEMLGPYRDTATPTLCRCNTCKSEVSPRLGSVRAGMGCFFCKHNMVGDETARRDFARAGVKMIGEYSTTTKPTICECLTCGNEVSPTLANVRSGKGACRYCAPGGFQLDKPGIVYLFRHDGHRALKVGITNDTSTRRLLTHERAGWLLVDLWFFDAGADAHSVEQSVLDAWENHKYATLPSEMPHGGYTETVSLDDVTEAEAVALIEETIASLVDAARLP